MAYLAFRSRASAAVPGTYATATQCLCGHLLITQSFSRFSDLLQGPGVCTGTDYDWLERFFWEKLKYCSMRTFFCFCFSALTWLVSVNGDRYFFVMQSLVLERWRFARSEDVCVHPVSDRQEHCFFFFFFLRLWHLFLLDGMLLLGTMELDACETGKFSLDDRSESFGPNICIYCHDASILHFY